MTRSTLDVLIEGAIVTAIVSAFVFTTAAIARPTPQADSHGKFSFGATGRRVSGSTTGIAAGSL
jgi:hypothetical protein